MLKFFLRFALERLKLCLFHLDSGKLLIKARFSLLNAVSFALVVALLLVELHLALLEPALGALNLSHFLRCELFSLSGDFYFFLPGFEEFVFLDYFSLFCRLLNDDFGS